MEMAREDSLSQEVLSMDLQAFPRDGRARRLHNSLIPLTTVSNEAVAADAAIVALCEENIEELMTDVVLFATEPGPNEVEEFAITSDEALSLDYELPQRAAVVGGGYIAVSSSLRQYVPWFITVGGLCS
ncbi:hypothetical protein K1719_004181 [Acacia pycnantha]|nr:hypothetical protein K1719_004181 [Acacia pycnantha]